MMKTNLTFKILSFILLAIDIAFAVFFFVNFILTLAKISVFGNIHLVLFVITIVLNVCYFVYAFATLKLHSK